MKALLVDDHPRAPAELQAIICDLDVRVRLVFAASVEAACALLALDASFDLVLLDLDDGTDGLLLVAQLREAHPLLPVALVWARGQVGTDGERPVGVRALGLLASPTRGARAHAPPPRPIEEPPAPVADVPWHFSSTARASLLALGLTRRQGDVLALLLEGQSNKAIARALNLSVDTVKDHVARLMRSLNVTSRTQAVLAVTQMAQGKAPSPWMRQTNWAVPSGLASELAPAALDPFRSGA